jgi:predicted phage replisome organizer
MSEPKRYFWLKLPNTYFSQLEQKKMRKQEHGKDMQIIYLRMMLLGIDKGGRVFYQNVYDTIEEELAEEFDEDVELIRETIQYLLDNSMVSLEDADICIPEAKVLTGSECYSAERVRNYRKKQKALQCNTDVTNSNGDVTVCNEEIEKELEKEGEKELDFVSADNNGVNVSKNPVNADINKNDNSLPKWEPLKKQIRLEDADINTPEGYAVIKEAYRQFLKRCYSGMKLTERDMRNWFVLQKQGYDYIPTGEE